MDKQPESLHERTPLVVGSKGEVELVEEFMHRHAKQEALVEG